MAMTLTGIHVYPLKSAAGVALETAWVERCGFTHDRRWMVVNAKGQFLTQRDFPRLALIKVQIGAGGGLILRAPDMPALTLGVPREDRERCEVRVWEDRVTATRMDNRCDLWLSRFLETDCRLVFLPEDVRRPLDLAYAHPGDHVSFADKFPFLLVSEASLADLNTRLDEPVAMNRFRPNLVVSGCEPFAEDDWKRIRIDNIVFRMAKPCSRCRVTTVDQETGLTGKEPLRTLQTYREHDGEIWFGVNLVPENTGRIRTGNGVIVVES
jgi:uncharacterized protein YcbX